MAARWQGANDPYFKSEDWREVRRLMKAKNIEANGELLCEKCWTRPKRWFEIHHLNYQYQRRELANWDKAKHTLALFCDECHHDEHMGDGSWAGLHDRLAAFSRRWGYS